MPPDLERIRGAFHELSTCRQIGMALGPIPWTAIDRYAERHGIGDFEQFATLVRACDAAYLGALKHG